MNKKQAPKSETAAVPGPRCTDSIPAITRHGRIIAPALASTVVLFATIGLSRELFMLDSPTFPITSVRQRAAGELSKSPVAAAPPARFVDDESFSGIKQILQEGKEGDRLRPEDSSSIHAAPDTGLESGRKDKNSGERRSNEKAGKLVNGEAGIAEPLDLASRDAPGIRAFPESQPEIESEAPSEEIYRRQAPQKADLSDADDEFNSPASREYDEISQAGEDGSVAVSEFESRKTKSFRAESPAVEILKLESILGAGSFADAGFDFLGHYQQSDQLYYQPATGYWANSYIPGDPEIRLLSARLARWDRSWLEHNAALEQDVEPVNQPFDAPADNALALSLMADASGVSADDSEQGLTRMRLQVGIRGIEHRRGQRPAMNVGVVVDLPVDAPDDVRIATRALLDALLQSKQAGDRFSLVMTAQQGKTRSLVVPAADFRFGSLQLAKQLILGQEFAPAADSLPPPPLDLSSLDLYEAMLHAGAMVQQTDDPSRPLGSSSVLLISAREIQDVERLAALAHDRAKEGITLSVLPLGSEPQSTDVESLVLAGLGNRRYLEAPGQARQLIEEELHASSRAVARAARLSIRLAPGVRLIDVVGSERLDAQRSQRVRDIENSMDRRLSANLGIQADRGEDEDGIQVVIPSIFSGDSVTVLLDIVTDRPGAIADVSLRYKDLVFLRNGSLRGHLDLPGAQYAANDPPRGPSELAVLKNLLSHHFVDAVKQAAAALGRQQAAEATAILSAMRATTDQARRDLPAWANDPDIIRDQQVLDRYIAALASPEAGSHQPFLADSLHYAAWAKTHRALEEWNQ